MEGNERRTVLLGLGTLLAMATLLFRGGARRTLLMPRPGPGKPDRPPAEPRPRITLPEGSVRRHG